MPDLSLPIYSPRPTAGVGVPEIDRRRPYPSCPWLEGGIAFNRRSLNACLIVHHNRGFPHLCDYNGGAIDFNAVLAARARIIAENQNGGHADCRGCPHLVTRRWRRPKHPVRLMAIAQFTHCNIECNYCYLQTTDPSGFSAGFDPYPVLEPIRAMARAGLLAPNLIVDWGGGEPTIYREFDAVLRFVTERGGTTWVHTNGTRLPRPLLEGLPTRRVNILCSVDAGTRETWKLIKKRDLLETVWHNLGQYVRLGCRVVLKYIVKEENCGEAEVRAFVSGALAVGAKEVLLDIDYDHPRPSEAVLAGLRSLKRIGTLSGLHVTLGSTGAFFTPEVDVAGRLSRRAVRSQGERVEFWVKEHFAWAGAQARALARRLRWR